MKYKYYKIGYYGLQIFDSTIPFANGGCQSLPQSTKHGFNPFANGGCQSLPQLTKHGFNRFANGGCQLETSKMGLHPLV